MPTPGCEADSFTSAARPGRCRGWPPVRRSVGLSWLVSLGLSIGVSVLGAGWAAADAHRRCAVVEIYALEHDPGHDRVVQAAEEFAAERPGVQVVRRFIESHVEDREALHRLAARYRFDAGRTPVIAVLGRVHAGVDDPGTVAATLAEALRVEVFSRPGCSRCTTAKAWLPSLVARMPALSVEHFDIVADPAARERLAHLVRRHGTAAASVPVIHIGNRLVVGFDGPAVTGGRVEALLEPWSRPCPAPIGTDDLLPGFDDGDPLEPSEAIDVSLFGRIDAGRLGMPLFTVVIGLIDGFNPCAMWVLLLLLSILVNVRDRVRIIAIAGTFVLVSGLAYFAFMAAWLHVFEWIGFLRPVQITLGLLAIAIGSIHVKDFFAFHQGVSLSIPESAKPGLYRRMRQIVTAENLPAALLATFTLAVLVNVVELLCTAGLPALYTSILSARGYSSAVRYGYLALYIAAYMFDDALMVATVVWSFRRFKLQETAGRWLKLVSGTVILLLGLVMLLKPEWLG